MIITLIRDDDDGTVDAVITSTTTTSEQIEDILDQVKVDVYEGKEDDDYLSLLKQRLPDDCEMMQRWEKDFSSKVGIIWY